ncbi:MAG: VCBS repeat-containing protein [Candidatus Marinimicrobia bacterium]|nr:VCBS repeat-containing protein [Candidatus Neomarinimicrobiota bacterium]
MVVFFTHCSFLGEPLLFKKLTPRETGITFENTLEEGSLFNSVNYLYFYDGGGVAVGDINNDGLADIYFTANMHPNRLYLNKGDFQFEDITETAGVGGGSTGWSTGVTMADVNGDGLLDIYVCRVDYLDRKGANQLFINNGDLTFTERAEEYGIAHGGLSTQAAFFDYDLDGDLDMYLLNHSVHSLGTYGDTSMRRIRDHEIGDKLYNYDQGRFFDVTAEAGIYESILGYGLGVAIGDINGDGYPDIYISNDFHEDDYLYYNNGDGTFTEALGISMGHTASASMGNDLADFNNDGLLDLVVLDMLPAQEDIRKSSVSADPYDIYNLKLQYGYSHQYRRNMLQLNRGPALNNNPGLKVAHQLFSEIGQLANVHATDWSWAALFVDLDNDGFKDLFITNGIYRRLNDRDYMSYIAQPEVQMQLTSTVDRTTPIAIEANRLAEVVQHMPSVPQANYAFHSQGDLTFIDRAVEWGLGDPGFSNGAAYADFDNDGAMDLVVNNVNSPAAIYKNLLYQNIKDSSNRANYLKVRLLGSGLNRFGIGAQVTLHYKDKLFFQHLMATRGFQSSVEPVLNFGLGNIETLDSLVVIWATGQYQVVRNLRANQIIALHETDATATYTEPAQVADQPLFQDITAEAQLDYVHQENGFIDFNREPFMPHFLSTEGPALAIGDVNGDGLDDLYLGGAKHQPGAIYLQDQLGSFKAAINSVFAADDWSEDVDAIFFDADNDQLPDLYVVSGGNEFWGSAERLLDRLYINEGGGRFRKAEGLLPEIYANGACVVPADVDNDGDMDLFVGSRSVSWQYGIIPQSYLLINDGQGKFTDETSSRAPGLSHVGMVTDALWVDLNRDSYLDLIVVGEWMPVTVFHNQNGELVDVTEEYGLQNSHGWWNTVAAADFNQDGFIDLVAGNLGLNSVLKASEDNPVNLFISDFSGNGRPDQILTYYNAGKSYPMASRDQMLFSIPALEIKYRTYADYAGQSVRDIFPDEQLEAATVRRAAEFASILLMNNGDGTFNSGLLPVEAQFSPLYSILIDDFNKDGYQDMLLGGNFYGVPPDQGRYDAGYGCLLLGDGAGAFTAATLQNSGVAITGEVRQIKSLQTATGETVVVVARNNDTVVMFRSGFE